MGSCRDQSKPWDYPSPGLHWCDIVLVWWWMLCLGCHWSFWEDVRPFFHTDLPGVHPCLSVASAGIPREQQHRTLCQICQICPLKNGGGLFFLPGARQFVSDCRYLTFLLPPHRSEPFIHVTTISCKLSLWFYNPFCAWSTLTSAPGIRQRFPVPVLDGHTPPPSLICYLLVIPCVLDVWQQHCNANLEGHRAVMSLQLPLMWQRWLSCNQALSQAFPWPKT